jgi:hypothetical protein
MVQVPGMVETQIEKSWRSACRAILGAEIGPLGDYKEWLSGFYHAPARFQSSISGKDVFLANGFYPEKGKYISLDETGAAKMKPLSINDIKDIDSIVEAIAGSAIYCGNMINGKCSDVISSTNISDSSTILSCHSLFNSRNMAYSSVCDGGDTCFGMLATTAPKCLIRCHGGINLTRCFECHSNDSLSDSFFCGSTNGCSNCMFSFGLYNKSHCIGNIQLSPEKYNSIKNKLVSEMREILQKDKKLFSLLDILDGCSNADAPKVKGAEPEFNIAPLERAFSETSGVLLRKKLSGMEDYAKYLERWTLKNGQYKSAFSGRGVYVPGFRTFIIDGRAREKRMVTDDEILLVSKKAMDERALDGLCMDKKALSAALSPIAFLAMTRLSGKNVNISKSSVVRNSSDCLLTSASIESKECAHACWPAHSDHMFGSSIAIYSSFCMKCYNSTKLMRCFEADCSNSCSDSYFLHNCENMRDSMFCFNAKSMKNAIGNTEFAPEEYKKAKDAVVAQIASELEGKKEFKRSIFNIGAI